MTWATCWASVAATSNSKRLVSRSWTWFFAVEKNYNNSQTSNMLAWWKYIWIRAKHVKEHGSSSYLVATNWAPGCDSFFKTTPYPRKWRCMGIQNQQHPAAKLHGFIKWSLPRIVGNCIVQGMLIVCVRTNPVRLEIKFSKRSMTAEAGEKQPNRFHPRMRDKPSRHLSLRILCHKPRDISRCQTTEAKEVEQHTLSEDMEKLVPGNVFVVKYIRQPCLAFLLQGGAWDNLGLGTLVFCCFHHSPKATSHAWD